MKVLIARPMTAEIEARARRDFDVEIRESNTPLTVSEMTHALQTCDIVVPTLGDRFNADVFAAVAAPQCKLLANFGAGYNHIDVSAAREAGIQVTNTPGAVTDATADIAMTLILMSARRAGEGERLVRSGEWSGWHPTQMLGQHVTGKSVGIVGMGRIGQAIARRCHFGFGMDVCYVARSEKDLDFEATRAPDLTAMAGMVDVLVVAVPGAPETYHLINADILQVMKPSAHLINIARGEIVEETALVQALETGGIAGAGLDVYEFEPAVPESLRSLDNVTLLPHLGTATAEVRTNMGHMALDNVGAFSKGLALPNPV